MGAVAHFLLASSISKQLDQLGCAHWLQLAHGESTYNGDNFILDCWRCGNNAEEEGEVYLYTALSSAF
jgi:hypothetical protein